jgi:hypothetical protein
MILADIETMVFEMGTLVWEMKTMVSKPETTVRASKKMMSVARIMVYKVLSIVFLIVEQSFANPKMVYFAAPARSHQNKILKFAARRLKPASARWMMHFGEQLMA